MKTLITTFAIALMAISFNPSVAFAEGETGEHIKESFDKVGEDIKRDLSTPAEKFFKGIPDYAKCMTNYDPGYNEGERKCGHHLVHLKKEERETFEAIAAKHGDAVMSEAIEYALGAIDDLRDLDSSGAERTVADSGDEGSTSATSAGDQ